MPVKPSPFPWSLSEYGSIVDATNTVIPVSGIAQPHGYVPRNDVSYANRDLLLAAPGKALIQYWITLTY